MSPAPRKKITLEDLDDEARAELLAQLKGDGEVRQTVAEQLARERDARLREQIDLRDHLRHCPMDGRVEAYPHTRPAKPQQGLPARPVTVVRCIECGGTTVLEREYQEFIASIQRDELDDPAEAEAAAA
jgi:hypothetical protein